MGWHITIFKKHETSRISKILKFQMKKILELHNTHLNQGNMNRSHRAKKSQNQIQLYQNIQYDAWLKDVVKNWNSIHRQKIVTVTVATKCLFQMKNRELLCVKIIPQTENLYFVQKNLTSYHRATSPKPLNRISLELASSIGSYVISKSENRWRWLTSDTLQTQYVHFLPLS